jgi:hypothetical protein
MLSRILTLAAVGLLAVLLLPNRVEGWGAVHRGVTRVGPGGGVYHAGRTVGVGPYGGVYAGGRAFGAGPYGGVYRGGYGYRGYGYGGYGYGGYGYGYRVTPYSYGYGYGVPYGYAW